MASKLIITLVLELMESPDTEQPYMTNWEQSMHLSHAASVAGRGKSMHQFVIWAPCGYTLSPSPIGEAEHHSGTYMMPSNKRSSLLRLPTDCTMGEGEAPQGVPHLGAVGRVDYTVTFRNEQRQAA